jgi:branched-chain amino acid transport system permease protein
VNKIKAILIGAMIIALALFPLITERQAIINLSILILLFVTLAQSWNLLGGYAGQINLGHAAFFGLGSLVARLLWMSGRPFWVGLVAGAAVAVAFALLIGVPAFRLRGIYFAIGTLALGEILNVTVGNRLPIVSALPAQYLATYDLAPRYYLVLALALLTTGATYVLANSRLGLGIMAVREEEEAAESLGISALRHKLLALCVSAFFASLAGAGFAYYHVSYYYQLPFSPMWTFDAMLVTFIGGAGTIGGPIIGAVFYVLAKERLAETFVEVHLLIFGVLFILVVLFLPGGLVQAWEKIQTAVAQRSRSRGSRSPAESEIEFPNQ